MIKMNFSIIQKSNAPPLFIPQPSLKKQPIISQNKTNNLKTDMFGRIIGEPCSSCGGAK